MAFIPSDKSFTAEGGSFQMARPNYLRTPAGATEPDLGDMLWDDDGEWGVEAIDPLGGKFVINMIDESITYMGGGPDKPPHGPYPAVGKVWTKAKDGTVYETMIGNLATGIGGKYRSEINDILGSSNVDAYVASAEKATGSVAYAAKAGDSTKGKGALSGTSIFDAWWFWPTIIVGSTVVIGGIVTYVVTQRREAAGEMVTKGRVAAGEMVAKVRKRVGV